jgi:hypothetical protein
MRKNLYHATMATLLFCVVMNIVISVYANTTGIDIEQHGWLHLLETVINFLYIVSALCFGIFVSMAVFRYINMPEERMTIPHCKAEVEWTEIERDEEGEEISRKHYKVELCHTMLDHQLDRVVHLWHRYRNKYEQNARTSQDFIDFVNGFTTFWAANTEEELVNRLKNK